MRTWGGRRRTRPSGRDSRGWARGSQWGMWGWGWARGCGGSAGRARPGRGELAVPLPAGYARRASGEVALDPDEQVQAVIRLVFRLFDELGTAHAVLWFLVGRL